MASPIKGDPYTFTISLLSATTGEVITDPTLDALDFFISTDDGAYTQLATTPTVTPASSEIVKISLTADEVGESYFAIKAEDFAGAEWQKVVYHETVQSANNDQEILDRIGLVMSVLHGEIGNAGTATEEYTQIVGGVEYKVSFTGLTPIGNRDSATYTKDGVGIDNLTLFIVE